MPAKSFIGEAEHAARHFYATVVRGEVSDENVRGYLGAASQIEDVWSDIDARLAELQTQQIPPWEAYARFGYALAFVRAARAYQVVTHELLTADAVADPATLGYLPRVTFDQANALCHQIQPNLRRAVAALTDPEYTPEFALPLAFGPRVEAEGLCPITHLQGMIAGAREVREWAAGLIAEYQNAVQSATVEAPPEIQAHLTELRSQLAQADSSMRFATDLVGQAFSRQHATPELHEDAEDALWEALGVFFVLNQAVALPELLHAAAHQKTNRKRKSAHRRQQGASAYRDRHIQPDDLWEIAAPSARVELKDSDFGTAEMEEMCKKMGGVLSARAQRYLDEVDTAVQRGDAYVIAAMANCPFEPLYRARRDLQVAGVDIPTGYEFHWNFHRGRLESFAHFDRVNDWRECEE